MFRKLLNMKSKKYAKYTKYKKSIQYSSFALLTQIFYQNLVNIQHIQLQYQQKMVSEFIHVSEVYETTMTIFVIILGVVQILSFCLDLPDKITQALVDGYKDQLNWNKQKSQSKEHQEQQQQQTEQQNELQKSVANYVQNQITNMEKVEEEPKEIKPVQLMQESQKPLSQNRQKVLKFYIAYNGFISENMSILMPILIVGILTQSTFVYSLAAFFCAIFCSIVFDFLRVQEQLKSEYKRGFVIRRLVKLLSGLIILSIFLSYWVLNEYNGV